jgi:putative SOS response-associated peptidase YedK
VAFPFRDEDGSLFAFAGIWDCWKSPEGKLLESCSILTSTPNDLVNEIHDRMPVILPQSHYEPWLTVTPAQADRLIEMLLPFDPKLMRRYEVGPLVNRPENDSPERVVEATGTGTNLELWGMRSVGIRKTWLPPRDSNPDTLLQRQMSYR